jgi:hypothetical protein
MPCCSPGLGFFLFSSFCLVTYIAFSCKEIYLNEKFSLALAARLGVKLCQGLRLAYNLEEQALKHLFIGLISIQRLIKEGWVVGYASRLVSAKAKVATTS